MLRKSNRIAPVEPPYDDETAAALASLGPPIGLFRIFARRPARARGVQGWGRYYLSRQSALSIRHRELVIDRTTALCGAEYEWGIHVAVFAAKARLDDAQVRSLTVGGAGDPCWTDPRDRGVLRAVDALHARSDLTDGEWADLVAATGEDGAVDLMLLCGWYHAISYVARSARLDPEPGSPTFAEVGRDQDPGHHDRRCLPACRSTSARARDGRRTTRGPVLAGGGVAGRVVDRAESDRIARRWGG